MILISNSSGTTFQNPTDDWCRNDASITECRRSFRRFQLKVEYDDEDLEGLMQMAQREKLSLSQVPAIIQEQERKDEEGNMEREQVFHKFIFWSFLLVFISRILRMKRKFLNIL